ncbi:MAG: serpin family protein [Saccharofermentanales bacterium]
MKKHIALFLSLLTLLMPLLSCSSQAAKAQTLAAPGAVKQDVLYTDVSDAFRKSLWAFADQTSGAALAARPGDNSLYSPVSLYYALAMLEAGAAGKTKADLRDFLAAPALTSIGSELGKLYSLMTIEGQGRAEQIANALWIREDLIGQGKNGVRQGWLDQMSTDFYASAFAVDFLKPKTSQIMSAWVEEATRGKIKPEIDVSDPDILMVLMNTVYFKADWVESFPKEGILKDVFYGNDEVFDQVPYLTGSFDRYSVLETDRYLAGSLPLLNGRMQFILPNEGITPEELLADPGLLTSLNEGAWTLARLQLRLPKFSYRTKVDVLEAMEGIGLTDIVKGSPDFSAMLDRGAEVSSISQETFIALDESGVEAAGYTEVIMRETSMLDPDLMEVVQLTLDRPFLYVISDDAGTPLFVGILRNPLKG